MYGIHWPIYPCKMFRGERPLLRENLAETDQLTPFKNADFQSIFARSTLHVTPGEKVQLTPIASPLPAFQ